MTSIEYRKDFLAFRELYEELAGIYVGIGEEDSEFESNFIDPSCSLKQFYFRWKHIAQEGYVRISRVEMDHRLDQLSAMECSLNELRLR